MKITPIILLTKNAQLITYSLRGGSYFKNVSVFNKLFVHELQFVRTKTKPLPGVPQLLCAKHNFPWLQASSRKVLFHRVAFYAIEMPFLRLLHHFTAKKLPVHTK